MGAEMALGGAVALPVSGRAAPVAQPSLARRRVAHTDPTRFVIPSEGQRTQQVPFPPMTVGAGLQIGVLSCFPACCLPRNITRYVPISHLISACTLSNEYKFA